MSDLLGGGGRGSWISRAGVPRLLLGALGAALIVIGLAEMLLDHGMWLYVVHLLSGLVSLAATPWRHLVKPTVGVMGALYVFLYVLESMIPQAVGEEQNPPSNAKLIMTGLVLVVLIVALMWPWQATVVQRGGRPRADGSDR